MLNHLTLFEQHSYRIGDACHLNDLYPLRGLMFLPGRYEYTFEPEFACLAYTLVYAIHRTYLARQTYLTGHTAVGRQGYIH